MQTIRRDWLRRQIEAGQIEARCNYHLTDDYRGDAADNFGKTEWMPARIRHPRFETYTSPWGAECQRCVDHDDPPGFLHFFASDVEGKSGMAYWESEPEGLIRFRIHSNAAFSMRVRLKPGEHTP